MAKPRRPSAAPGMPSVILLLAACSLVSCQRSASSRAAAARPPGTASTPVATAPSTARQAAAPAGPPPAALAGSPTARPPKSVSPPATGGPTAPPSPLAANRASAADTGTLGLLCRGPQDGTLPEDFEIGPLAAPRLLEGDARAAYDAAASLLDAFARGRIERTDLAAGSRDALAGLLAFALERGDRPTAWRLGPPRASNEEWIANLRLLGSSGSAEGELYARREAADILVSDLQIDPARIRVRREPPGRTFFPSPYRWLLGG